MSQEKPIFTHSNNLNINHLSASTINLFITSRFGFYQSKIAGAPFQGSVHTARGQAIEHGVNTWIEKPECGVLLDVVNAKYDEECKKAGISKLAGEDMRESLPGLLEIALKFYKSEFATDKALTQQKIEGTLDGVDRVILGYLDYLQIGKAVRDCKVSSKSPSKLSQSYILQGSFYRKTTGLPVYFDFFIPNKKPVHVPIKLNDDEYVFGLSYMTVAAKVIEELEQCDDPKRILKLMSFPDLSSMWTDSDVKAAAKEWGIQLR